jgi:hypothetical protein
MSGRLARRQRFFEWFVKEKAKEKEQTTKKKRAKNELFQEIGQRITLQRKTPIDSSAWKAMRDGSPLDKTVYTDDDQVIHKRLPGSFENGKRK